MLAGYFSKAGNSGQIPVDYTLIKNVHKPSGAKPGFVTYDNQKLCMLHLIMNLFKNETIIIKLSTNKHLTIRKDYFLLRGVYLLFNAFIETKYRVFK